MDIKYTEAILNNLLLEHKPKILNSNEGYDPLDSQDWYVLIITNDQKPIEDVDTYENYCKYIHWRDFGEDYIGGDVINKYLTEMCKLLLPITVDHKVYIYPMYKDRITEIVYTLNNDGTIVGRLGTMVPSFKFYETVSQLKVD